MRKPKPIKIPAFQPYKPQPDPFMEIIQKALPTLLDKFTDTKFEVSVKLNAKQFSEFGNLAKKWRK